MATLPKYSFPKGSWHEPSAPFWEDTNCHWQHIFIIGIHSSGSPHHQTGSTLNTKWLPHSSWMIDLQMHRWLVVTDCKDTNNFQPTKDNPTFFPSCPYNSQPPSPTSPRNYWYPHVSDPHLYHFKRLRGIIMSLCSFSRYALWKRQSRAPLSNKRKAPPDKCQAMPFFLRSAR